MPHPDENTPEFAEKMTRFACGRCGNCCRQPGYVHLEEEEAARMAAHLGMDLYAFTDRYCEVRDRRRLVLKKNADESCVFLTGEGCSVHPVKPRQCVDFPSVWRTPKSFNYCHGLKVLFQPPQ